MRKRRHPPSPPRLDRGPDGRLVLFGSASDLPPPCQCSSFVDVSLVGPHRQIVFIRFLSPTKRSAHVLSLRDLASVYRSVVIQEWHGVVERLCPRHQDAAREAARRFLLDPNYLPCPVLLVAC